MKTWVERTIMKSVFRIGWVVLILVAVSCPALAAQVVVVLSAAEPANQAVAAGFKAAYKGDYQELNLEGSDERQRSVGEELKAQKPAAVVVIGDLAAQMAKWYLTGVPVVYCDAVRAAQLSLTQEKAAGVYHEPDPAEQLKVMKELFPEKKKVGLLYCPEYTPVNEGKLKSDAQAQAISLQIGAVGSIKDLPVVIRNVMPQVELIWVFTDPVVFSSHSIQYLVLESISAGVPIFCGDRLLSHAGATAALVPDLADVGKKAAAETGQILQGVAPAPGMLIYPGGQLVLNQKTAAMLGVSFPPALVSRAVEVIQ